jgi:hypothetical protein
MYTEEQLADIDQHISQADEFDWSQYTERVGVFSRARFNQYHLEDYYHDNMCHARYKLGIAQRAIEGILASLDD